MNQHEKRQIINKIKNIAIMYELLDPSDYEESMLKNKKLKQLKEIAELLKNQKNKPMLTLIKN